MHGAVWLWIHFRLLLMSEARPVRDDAAQGPVLSVTAIVQSSIVTACCTIFIEECRVLEQSVCAPWRIIFDAM